MYSGILSTIGETPLVELRRLFPRHRVRFFAKLEAFNPGGSIKDRPAYTILRHALDEGLIRPGGTVVESSSGNMGIGLAQVCGYLGLRFICVIDPKTTQQNVKILQAYGATVDLVAEPDAETGEFLPARLKRVQTLLATVPGSFWPNQYANPLNARSHYATMREIIAALDGPLDYLFCSASTCGTIRGCADYLQEHRLPTKIIAADAVGSAIFEHSCGQRLIPGHGASLRPELYRDGVAQHYLLVTDLDCVIWCRRLLRREAILAGGSSGAVLAAVDKALVEGLIPPGATCAAILADRGERYLDTIYSDQWVAEKFGAVARYWET